MAKKKKLPPKKNTLVFRMQPKKPVAKPGQKKPVKPTKPGKKPAIQIPRSLGRPAPARGARPGTPARPTPKPAPAKSGGWFRPSQPAKPTPAKPAARTSFFSPKPAAAPANRSNPITPAAAIATAATILDSEYVDPRDEEAVDTILDEVEADMEQEQEEEGYDEEESSEEEEEGSEEDESAMGFELPGSAMIKAKTGSTYVAPLLYAAVGAAIVVAATRAIQRRSRRRY